jgi:hypothetical protein
MLRLSGSSLPALLYAHTTPLLLLAYNPHFGHSIATQRPAFATRGISKYADVAPGLRPSHTRV